MSKKIIYAPLDDLTISSNKKDIFSHGRPLTANIDNLVMKPPKILPCLYQANALSQKKKAISLDECAKLRTPKTLHCQYKANALPQEQKLIGTDKSVKSKLPTTSCQYRANALSNKKKATSPYECDELRIPKTLQCQYKATALPQEQKSNGTDESGKPRHLKTSAQYKGNALSQKKKSTDDECDELHISKTLPCQDITNALPQERQPIGDDECDELSERELLECLSTLQNLEKREEELKIAILYEKLKKEDSVSDQSLENIDQLQQKLEQTKQTARMRQVYNSKKQQTELFRRITQPPVLKHKNKAEDFEFSDEARTFILNIMSEKKQKEKDMDQLQKQIKEAEETYLQLKTKINDFTATPKKPKMTTSIKEELKHLKEENNKRSSRIQLLSYITKTLIDNITIQDNLKDDLKLLALSCENILNWDSEDLDELKESCKKVFSTEI